MPNGVPRVVAAPLPAIAFEYRTAEPGRAWVTIKEGPQYQPKGWPDE